MSDNNITWAAVQMLAGLKVTRSGWGEYGYLTIPRRGLQHLYLTKEDGATAIWSPLANDLLIPDWVLYVEEPK